MNTGTPPSMVYRQQETIDRHYEAAVEAVCMAGFGSTRLLQDRLGIGYYQASLLVEAMQESGVLGEFDGEVSRYELVEARGFY